MAQQIINVGAAPNDGQGDPIRTAFQKTNSNFTELYARAQTLPPVSLTGQLGDVPGMYAYDSTYFYYCFDTWDGSSIIWAQVTQVGPISTNQIVSGNSNVVVTGAGGTVTVGVGGTNNIAVFTTTGANITGNVAASGYVLGNGSLLTGLPATYANANVQAYAESGWSGNIVPAANAAYNLGSASNQWKSLYVSNTTIYLGNVAIGVTGGNTLTVAGQPVLSNDSTANITTTGNVAVGAILTDGYFFANGAPFVASSEYGNANVVANLAALASNPISTAGNITAANINITAGTINWANAGIVQTSASDLSITGDGQVSIRSQDGTYQWTFTDLGNLAAPGNISTSANVSANNINMTGTLTVNLIRSDDSSFVTIEDGLDVNGDATATSLSTTGNVTGAYFIGDGSQLTGINASGNSISNGTSNVEIPVANGAVTINTNGNFQYQFGNDGGLYIPNNGALVGVTANNNGYINWVGNSSGDNNGFTTMQLVPDATVDSQILVLDPTSPGHIHLRAPGIGGNVEQPAANIYLGAEDTNFEITAQYANAAEARIHSAGNTWTFANDGNLLLPGQSTIVGVTANNAGHLQWIGNSSGDGAGYTTLQLIPDDTVTGGDQYVIIDPTAPGHIHIRAGGTQDNSSADLFLGGENSYFKVNAGANNEVRISANSHAWVFGADSVLTLPGEGVLRSIGDSVTLQSINVGSGNANSVYLSSGGGLGFFDQEIGTNWLQIFRSGAEPEITIPFGYGNANLYINNSSSGNVLTWTFGADGAFTAPGNISATDVSVSGNVVGNTAGYTIGYLDIPQITFSANATAALTDAGKHYYSTTAGNLALTLPDNNSVAFATGSTLTIVVNAAGNVLVNQGSGVSLYQAGSSATGNRVVGAYGLATVMKVAANTWVISGTGVY